MISADIYSVCVASIVRIHYLTFLHHNVDITWTLSEVSVWSTVEPCIGIICACLPTLQPFIRSITRKLPGQHRGTGQVSSMLERNTSSRQTSSRRGHQHGMWHGQEQEGTMSLKTFFLVEDDRMRLTSLSTRVEMDDSRDCENLEDTLDPTTIRVKRDVHWAVD